MSESIPESMAGAHEAREEALEALKVLVGQFRYSEESCYVLANQAYYEVHPQDD